MNELIELVLKRGNPNVMRATTHEWLTKGEARKHGKRSAKVKRIKMHEPGEKDRKEMIRMWLDNGNYRETARATGWSESQVRFAVNRYQDGKPLKNKAELSMGTKE